MNIIMKRNIYILCNKKMKLLFTMNIDSLSMWRVIISILESRIKSAYQFGEQVETCRIWHEREFTISWKNYEKMSSVSCITLNKKRKNI